VEIVLALGAALAWGFADFASGVKSRTNSTIVVTAIVLGAGGIVTLVIAAATEEAPSGRTVALALAAGAATGLGVTMFFHALAIGVIGTVAPITCAGTSVPVIWGLVQGERPSIGQLLGVVLAIGGVVVIARAVADEDTTPAVNAKLALILAIAAAFTLGTYYVVAREASDAGPLWYAALGQLFAATPLVLLAFARRAPIPNPRESRALLGIAMANGAGWILSVNALKEGLLSVVSVLIALYPALTVLFARIFLSERLTQLQRAGAGIVFAGVALIAAT
jgi:drug/metabolite transporter (DMT)-like permease